MMRGRIQPAMEETAQEILQTVESIENATENLETAIVNNGGTDFNKRRFFAGTTTTQHQSTLVAQITGKGLLHSIYNTTTQSLGVTMQIDDGDVFSFSFVGNMQLPIVIGFNSSLKIYAGTPAIKCLYSLE